MKLGILYKDLADFIKAEDFDFHQYHVSLRIIVLSIEECKFVSKFISYLYKWHLEQKYFREVQKRKNVFAFEKRYKLWVSIIHNYNLPTSLRLQISTKIAEKKEF